VTNGAASTTSLASVRTDASTGAFSSPVTSSGPVLVTLTVDSNSKMLDELSGTVVAAPTGLVLHALLDSVTDQEAIAITPLTEMAYDIALAASGGLTAANNDAADNAVSSAFLDGAPVLDTQPIDIKNYKSAPAAQQELAKLLVAFALAANEGTATDSTGAACAGATYAARLVCMIGGLGKLLTVDSTGKGTLASNANYIEAAYQQLSNGTVTVDGGQTPSTLGLNVVTQAETAFETAVSTQAPLPGYNASAAPLANTKAFFADIRTNILDPTASQNIGLAPQVAAVAADIKANVEPAFDNTVLAVSAMNIASDLITAGLSAVGVGSTAGMDGPEGLALVNGTLYVADYQDDTIVAVNSTGVISPVAGSLGQIGATNAAGSAARFDSPDSVTADGAGNLYIADYNNNSIRMITPSGAVTTIAGGGNGPTPANPGYVLGFQDGPGATALFSSPSGIVFDPHTGNLFVADALNCAIRMISLSPPYTVTTIAGGGGVVQGPSVLGTSGFQDGAGSSALFFIPFGIAVDGSGNLYVADTFNHAIRKIVAGTYAVSTVAGGGGNNATNTVGISGYANGTAGSSAVLFNKPFQVAVDGNGNIFVADAFNSVIREISGGMVSLFAGTAPTGTSTSPVAVVGDTDGAPGVATFSLPADVIVTGTGTLYVADYRNAAIRAVDTSGNVTTFAKSDRRYRAEKHSIQCGYDPVVLATPNNVALCRYGRNSNPTLMTVTQTAAGTFDVKTQPLTGTPSYGPGVNPILMGLTPSANLAPLDASFTLVPGTNIVTGTVSGPYYVTAAGGQVTANITVAVSNLDGITGSGTITASGTLTKGSGGISLTNATLGSDTQVILKNDYGLGQGISGFANEGTPPPHGLTATLDLSNVTTSAYSYAAKFVIGAGVADKSGTYDVPSSVTLSGSIATVGTGGTLTPLFSGDVSLALMGIASYDATMPISSTNFATAAAQVAGDFSLSGGRVLTVSAALNASLAVPTPATPDSLTVTYTYATPTGTRQVNATAQYDSVNGYSGTLTNNGGVKVTLTYPLSGGLSGTVTDNGTETATITPTGTPGPTINYSDGTTEWLF
jgi:hypothetical protein